MRRRLPPLSLLLLATASAGVSGCVGLWCGLEGGAGYRWSGDAVELALNISADQEAAVGNLTRDGTIEPVSARLEFSRGATEALLSWSGEPINTTSPHLTVATNYTALVFSVSPDHLCASTSSRTHVALHLHPRPSIAPIAWRDVPPSQVAARQRRDAPRARARDAGRSG